MATAVLEHPRAQAGFLTKLNGAWHYQSLTFYLVVVASHWMEHAVQAIQYYLLGRPKTQSLGLLGSVFPDLIKSEALHYGYALFMLVGLFLLRDGFTGTARRWWTAALVIQIWHFIEHALLFAQATFHFTLLGAAEPTSVIQLVLPRIELHLIYNMLVLIPLLIAIGEHWFRDAPGEERPQCSCARRTARQAELRGHASR